MIRLPDLAHIPGQTPRPDPALFAPYRGEAALAAGLAAFRARYYWEAHEFWEPVWAAFPPASAERHLMAGVIQLANAGLKHRMGRPRAAARLLVLAESALARGQGALGLEVLQSPAMVAQIRQDMQDNA